MILAATVFVYLAIVLWIGIFARGRARRQGDTEDYFLAGRSLGPGRSGNNRSRLPPGRADDYGLGAADGGHLPFERQVARD